MNCRTSVAAATGGDTGDPFLTQTVVQYLDASLPNSCTLPTPDAEAEDIKTQQSKSSKISDGNRTFLRVPPLHSGTGRYK
jgi:hypothetical protein